MFKVAIQRIFPEINGACRLAPLLPATQGGSRTGNAGRDDATGDAYRALGLRRRTWWDGFGHLNFKSNNWLFRV